MIAGDARDDHRVFAPRERGARSNRVAPTNDFSVKVKVRIWPLLFESYKRIVAGLVIEDAETGR